MAPGQRKSSNPIIPSNRLFHAIQIKLLPLSLNFPIATRKIQDKISKIIAKNILDIKIQKPKYFKQKHPNDNYQWVPHK